MSIRSEADVRKSEEALRAVLEGAVDYAIIALDANGVVTTWNSGARNLFGWSEAEVVGRSADLIFTPEDRADRGLQREMAEARANGRARDEKWHLRKDGNRFWAHGELMPIPGPGASSGFVKIVRDRTEERREHERREQAESALRESEARLQLAMSAARMAVWRFDPAAGRLEGNPEFYALLGYPRDSKLGLDDMVVAEGPEQWEKLGAAVQSALSQGERFFQTEFRCVTPDGAHRAYLMRAEMHIDAANRFAGAIGVLIDITERIAAEAALAASHKETSDILERISDAFYALDADRRYVYINRRAEEMSGRPREELLGRVYEEVFPQTVGTPIHEAHLKAARTGEMVRVESRSSALGVWLDVSVYPGPNGVSVYFQDISRRKADESALRRLKDHLEAEVAERTRERDRIWVLSDQLLGVADTTRRFVSVNPAFTAVLGWTEEQMVGTGCDALAHPEDRAATDAALARLAAGERRVTYEGRFRTENGEWRCINWSATADDGQIYLVGRDVTAEREAAATLHHTEEQLRQSQKMEAIGQLTGGVAHDFNNLLTGILGGLDLVQKRLAEGRVEDAGRFMEAAVSSANRAAALTQRLLAFSRRQPLEPRPVDLNALVGSLEDLLRRTVGESIALSIELAPDLWGAYADPHQLESALLNLAINARDAMTDGGRLTLSTSNVQLRPRDVERFEEELAPGEYVRIAVADTGAGMPPEVRAKAFDPFFTTKPEGQGTGLGLSMVYGFAKQSGGQVHIESEVRKGTTIELYLPRREGEIETDEAPAAHGAPRAAAGEAVLVVEDDDSVRLLIVETLHDLGYRTLEAQDAGAAMRLLDGETRLDLMIADVGLPGLSGRRLADFARETRSDLKVLFVTGYAEEAAEVEGVLADGMEMIAKPFTVGALAVKIREMLEAGAR